MRQKEASTVGEANYQLSGTRTDILAWAWGEHLHLKDVLPAKWCGKSTNINIRFNTTERGQFRISVELTPPLVTPPGGTPSGILSISADDPEIRPFVEREQLVYDINERWTKVDKQILDFLGKCKSVNEALKLWPQVEMYIPKSYIGRVNEKRDRNPSTPSQAAEALKAMDTEHLTTAAVISRMSGPGKE